MGDTCPHTGDTRRVLSLTPRTSPRTSNSITHSTTTDFTRAESVAACSLRCSHDGHSDRSDREPVATPLHELSDESSEAATDSAAQDRRAPEQTMHRSFLSLHSDKTSLHRACSHTAHHTQSNGLHNNHSSTNNNTNSNNNRTIVYRKDDRHSREHAHNVGTTQRQQQKQHINHDASPACTPPPHTLAQLYLDADAPTYEALCTTGVSPIHITRNDPHTSALTSASLCEHHDKSNGDGTVDAALTLLEEVQLCNIIPVLPRTFSTLSLVQQIIPCTAWNSPSSSFSSSALSFSARCAAHLTAAQREHTFRLMLRSDLLQPFSWELMTCRHSLPPPHTGAGNEEAEGCDQTALSWASRPKTKLDDAQHMHCRTYACSSRVVGTNHSSVCHHTACDAAWGNGHDDAGGCSSSTNTTTASCTSYACAWERLSGRLCAAAQAQMESDETLCNPAAALVEWSSGSVGATTDTDDLVAEQCVRVGRFYYLPPTASSLLRARYGALVQRGSPGSRGVCVANKTPITSVSATNSSDGSGSNRLYTHAEADDTQEQEHEQEQENELEHVRCVSGSGGTGETRRSECGVRTDCAANAAKPNDVLAHARDVRAVAHTQLSRLRCFRTERSIYLRAHYQQQKQQQEGSENSLQSSRLTHGAGVDRGVYCVADAVANNNVNAAACATYSNVSVDVENEENAVKQKVTHGVYHQHDGAAHTHPHSKHESAAPSPASARRCAAHDGRRDAACRINMAMSTYSCPCHRCTRWEPRFAQVVLELGALAPFLQQLHQSCTWPSKSHHTTASATKSTSASSSASAFSSSSACAALKSAPLPRPARSTSSDDTQSRVSASHHTTAASSSSSSQACTNKGHTRRKTNSPGQAHDEWPSAPASALPIHSFSLADQHSSSQADSPHLCVPPHGDAVVAHTIHLHTVFPHLRTLLTPNDDATPSTQSNSKHNSSLSTSSSSPPLCDLSHATTPADPVLDAACRGDSPHAIHLPTPAPLHSRFAQDVLRGASPCICPETDSRIVPGRNGPASPALSHEEALTRWIALATLDEVLLIALAPRGLPYALQLRTLGESYALLLAHALEELCEVSACEVVWPQNVACANTNTNHADDGSSAHVHANTLNADACASDGASLVHAEGVRTRMSKTPSMEKEARRYTHAALGANHTASFSASSSASSSSLSLSSSVSSVSACYETAGGHTVSCVDARIVYRRHLLAAVRASVPELIWAAVQRYRVHATRTPLCMHQQVHEQAGDDVISTAAAAAVAASTGDCTCDTNYTNTPARQSNTDERGGMHVYTHGEKEVVSLNCHPTHVVLPTCSTRPCHAEPCRPLHRSLHTDKSIHAKLSFSNQTPTYTLPQEDASQLGEVIEVALHHAHRIVAQSAERVITPVIAALRPILHRRTFVMYELLRLMSSRASMVLPSNKTLILRYRHWYATTPSPAAVLRALQQSALFARALDALLPGHLQFTCRACGTRRHPRMTEATSAEGGEVDGVIGGSSKWRRRQRKRRKGSTTEEVSSEPAWTTRRGARKRGRMNVDADDDVDGDDAYKERVGVGRTGSLKAHHHTTHTIGDVHESSSCSGRQGCCDAVSYTECATCMWETSQGFVPEIALLDAHYLDRFAQWVGASFHPSVSSPTSAAGSTKTTRATTASTSRDGTTTVALAGGDSSRRARVDKATGGCLSETSHAAAPDRALRTLLHYIRTTGRTMSLSEIDVHCTDMSKRPSHRHG